MSHRTSRRRDGFTLIEMLVVVGLIGFFIMALVVMVPYLLRRSEITNCKAFVDKLAMAVEMYRERYRAYPPSLPGTASLSSSGLKSNLAQDTSKNLHFYLGAPRPELIRAGQTSVDDQWSVKPPIMDFRDEQLGTHNAAALGVACAARMSPTPATNIANMKTLISNAAVRAAVYPVVDPWGNNLWYGQGDPADVANVTLKKPDLTKSFTIESLGPANKDGYYTWYNGTASSYDNDVVNWAKPR